MDSFNCTFFSWSIHSESMCSNDKYCMSCYWSVLAYKPTKSTNQIPSPFWESPRGKLSCVPDPENILFALVEHRRQDHECSTQSGCPQQQNMSTYLSWLLISLQNFKLRQSQQSRTPSMQDFRELSQQLDLKPAANRKPVQLFVSARVLIFFFWHFILCSSLHYQGTCIHSI